MGVTRWESDKNRNEAASKGNDTASFLFYLLAYSASIVISAPAA